MPAGAALVGRVSRAPRRSGSTAVPHSRVATSTSADSARSFGSARPATCPDHCRLRLRRRGRDPGRPEDHAGTRRPRHVRDHRRDRAEFPRRTGVSDLAGRGGTRSDRAVLDDIGADAIKTRMPSSADSSSPWPKPSATTACPPWSIRSRVSKHGDPLLALARPRGSAPGAAPARDRRHPNLDEVHLLTGLRVEDVSELPKAAEAVLAFGSQWVLVKGGHLDGDAVDLLTDGDSMVELRAPRWDNAHTHGTGLHARASGVRRLGEGDGSDPGDLGGQGVRDGSDPGGICPRSRDRPGGSWLAAARGRRLTGSGQARTTLPAFRHEVQTLSRLGVLPTSA